MKERGISAAADPKGSPILRPSYRGSQQLIEIVKFTVNQLCAGMQVQFNVFLISALDERIGWL